MSNKQKQHSPWHNRTRSSICRTQYRRTRVFRSQKEEAQLNLQHAAAELQEQKNSEHKSGTSRTRSHECEIALEKKKIRKSPYENALRSAATTEKEHKRSFRWFSFYKKKPLFLPSMKYEMPVALPMIFSFDTTVYSERRRFIGFKMKMPYDVRKTHTAKATELQRWKKFWKLRNRMDDRICTALLLEEADDRLVTRKKRCSNENILSLLKLWRPTAFLQKVNTNLHTTVETEQDAIFKCLETVETKNKISLDHCSILEQQMFRKRENWYHQSECWCCPKCPRQDCSSLTWKVQNRAANASQSEWSVETRKNGTLSGKTTRTTHRLTTTVDVPASLGKCSAKLAAETAKTNLRRNAIRAPETDSLPMSLFTKGETVTTAEDIITLKQMDCIFSPMFPKPIFSP